MLASLTGAHRGCGAPAQAGANDDTLVAESRARVEAVLARPDGPGAQAQAVRMKTTIAQFQRYVAALPAAWAVEDMDALGDKAAADAPTPHAGLTRLPLDAAGLNKALGIDPSSPDAITDRNLRDDATGFRAALYRSDTDGRIILVPRQTEPHSLVDWQTNVENALGQDTPQYQAARVLAGKLTDAGVSFDVAGYSKGGGLAQEAGLVAAGSRVYVFNSVGLNPASLARTGIASFRSLEARTSAFSSQGDFVTYLDTTTDPAGELANVRFLRDELAGAPDLVSRLAQEPVKIEYDSPADRNANDPGYLVARKRFLNGLDTLIAEHRAHPGSALMFPPVRAGTFDTVADSWHGTLGLAELPGPSLFKVAAHELKNVVGPMEHQIDDDRDAMTDFVKS